MALVGFGIVAVLVTVAVWGLCLFAVDTVTSLVRRPYDWERDG